MSVETLGQEMRRRRRKLLLSQADLAELADVSRNTISNLERGHSQTDKRIVQALRDVLDAAESDGASRTRPKNYPIDTVRESIARTLDALAQAIPEDLFPTDSASPEAMAVRATRRAYLNAARIARGEDL